MNKKHLAYMQMVVASVLWSIAGIFIKLIDANPFTIAGLRSAVAIIPVIVMMAVNHEKLKPTKNALISAVFMMLTFNAFVAANKLTTAANAIVLQFTAPIFIEIISIVFLHEKAKMIDILAVALTFIGISFFFFEQMDGGGLLGNIIAVLAGFFMAFMYIAVNRADPSEKMSSIFFGQAFTAIAGIIAGLILPTFSGKIPDALTVPFNLSPMGWLCIFILGVVQLGIPYVLVGLASKNCSALACSLIGVIEPLLNPVWVAIFDGEIPGIFALIGAVIIIVSVSGWCILSDREGSAKTRTDRSMSK